METPHPLDLEATVPDIEAALSPFAAASALARDALHFQADLGYGDTEMECLDFFPAGLKRSKRKAERSSMPGPRWGAPANTLSHPPTTISQFVFACVILTTF